LSRVEFALTKNRTRLRQPIAARERLCVIIQPGMFVGKGTPPPSGNANPQGNLLHAAISGKVILCYVEIWLILLAIGFAALGLAQSQSSIV